MVILHGGQKSVFMPAGMLLPLAYCHQAITPKGMDSSYCPTIHVIFVILSVNAYLNS